MLDIHFFIWYYLRVARKDEQQQQKKRKLKKVLKRLDNLKIKCYNLSASRSKGDKLTI